MSREEELQSLLVQVAKLQVALRQVTTDRDALKTELAEQTCSQQQCLQLLLDARQQLQHFQVSLCTVRDSNQQLQAHNHKLQQQIQLLQQHSHTRQRQQQQQRHVQQPQLQEVQQEQLDHFYLLSPLAARWDHVGSTATSMTSSESGGSSCASGGAGNRANSAGGYGASKCDIVADTSSTASSGSSYCLARDYDRQQHHTAADWPTHSSAAGNVMQQGVSGLGHHQQRQQQVSSMQRGPYHQQHNNVAIATQGAEAAQAAAAELSSAATAKAEHHVSPSADAPVPVEHPATEQHHPGRVHPQQEQLQPVATASGQDSTPGADIVQLTQQQLDSILAEIANLQQKLADTAAKLDAVSPQHTQQSDSPAPPPPRQQQQQQQAHVPLQIGDQSISEWYQQLKLKQQQLHSRQQQLLGLEQPSQIQLQQAGAPQKQRLAANRRRLQEQQQQQKGSRQPGPQGAQCSHVPWNYQNRQLQQEQLQRRQQSGIRFRALSQHASRHPGAPEAVDTGGTQMVQGIEQVESSACTQQQKQQQQHEIDIRQQQRQRQQQRRGASCPMQQVNAAKSDAAPEEVAAAVTEQPACSAAVSTSGCAQPECSWLSSGSSVHDADVNAPAAAQAVLFMQLSTSQGPGVVRAVRVPQQRCIQT